jgi:hypothetical protein
MRKYIYIAVAVLMAVLMAGVIILWQSNNKYKDLYERELQNVNAYQISNSGLEGEIRQYRLTIDELYDSKDSIDRKLVATMHELDITKSKIKNLQYQLKVATRTDTITLHDTIFERQVDIDTTLGDQWYNLRLQLQYPSTVITTPSFKSEQYVYIYNRKEYVGGKSKWFFINWFKKKYTVTDVKIEEENPYIKTLNQKFIEIDE